MGLLSDYYKKTPLDTIKKTPNIDLGLNTIGQGMGGQTTIPVANSTTPNITPKSVFNVAKDVFTGADNTTGGLIRNTLSGVTLPNVYKEAGKIGVGLLQGIARQVGSAAITAANAPTQISNAILPAKYKEELPQPGIIPTTGNKITEAVFGGKPIKSVQEQAKTFQEVTKPYIGEKASSFLKYPAVVGGLVLDLSPWGGEKKVISSLKNDIPEAFFKAMVKETRPTVVENTLKTIGIDAVTAKELAPKFASSKTVQEAQDVFMNFGKTPKVTDELKSTVAKELSNIDITPVKTNAGLVFGNTDEQFRLGQLQKVIEKRDLTNAEVNEAIPLLKNAGIDVVKQDPISEFKSYLTSSDPEVKQLAKNLEVDLSRIDKRSQPSNAESMVTYIKEFIAQKANKIPISTTAPTTNISSRIIEPIIPEKKGIIKTITEGYKNIPNKQGGFARLPFGKSQQEWADMVGADEVRKEIKQDVTQVVKGDYEQVIDDIANGKMKIKITPALEKDAILRNFTKGEYTSFVRRNEGKTIDNLFDNTKLQGKDVDFSKVMDDVLARKEQIKMEKQIPKEPKSTVPVETKRVLQERGYVTSVKEKLPEINKIAGQYIPRSTDELATKARNLIKDDINTAEKLAFTGTDENAVATASELLKHYAEQANLATDQSIKNALYDRAAELGNTMAHKLTEQGRTVQAASILGRLTPEGQVRFAAREIQKYNEGVKIKDKIPELTGEQTKYIVDEMNAINRMADGVERGIRFQKLQDYITKLVPTPLFKKIITVWKAGLLTGMKTTGVNILANLSHAATETVKDIPATMVDKIVSLFTGKRTVTTNLKGVLPGFKQGADKGIQYFKTGFDERDIGTKLDYTRINFGKGKIARALQAYTDTVFRLLGSEDQPFYYGAKIRSLYEQAKVSAINKGLRGEEAQKYIDELIKNPTDEMTKYASLDAETAVFQNETILAKAARAVQKIPGGEVIVPFGRTPSAVAMQVLNYTPVGAISTIVKQIKEGTFDQRTFSQGIGRSLTGLAALGLGGYLYKNDMLTTSRPTGEKEQKLWELEGKQPNSIKIGNKWRQIQVLGPIGNVLLIGGSFQKAYDNTGTISGSASEGLADASKSFTQQTFLTGVSNFIDAVSDPARSATYVAGSTLASVVPTIVSDVARATDTKERRAETILNKLQARIPGVREILEPQVTVLGEEKSTVGNPLEIMIDPTRPSNVKKTPVIDELRRLWDKNIKVSPTLLGDKTGYSVLTPEQNTKLWVNAGKITNEKLNNLIKLDEYKKLSDEKKGKVVDNIVGKSTEAARTSMVIELTDGLSGDKLKTKLSELKKGKLLSQEVFNNYLKLR